MEIQDHVDDIPEFEVIKKSKTKQFIILSIILSVIVYIILDYTIPGLGYVSRFLTDFLEWFEDNPIVGAISFSLVYVIATIFFIPGLFLTLGAGLVFGKVLGIGLGVLVGTVVVMIGASVGAIVSFFLGRFVLREQSQKLFEKFRILKAIDRAFESEGLKLIILLRLSPVVPFSVFNYVMGVTSVKIKDYIIALFAMIPGTAAYVFIGTSASNLIGDSDSSESSDGNNLQLIVFIIGGIATFIAVALISVYSKKALNNIIREEELSNEEVSNV